MQAELGWQQLCGSAESDQFWRAEDLSQSLSSAGEQMFQHDDGSLLSKDISTLEIKKLQEQNAGLRAVIAQMRREMESLDDQLSSSLPLKEKRQLEEQDSVCRHNIAAAAVLSNVEASSPHLDCTVNPAPGKAPNPKAPEQKIIDPGQQLLNNGPAVGLRCDVHCTLQGMQNELKEAARKISILIQEKQQLIEMGNGLRAELKMVLKEGLQHPVSTKRCTVCVASGGLFPRELLKRTQCKLSALKLLQHRLTTQVPPDLCVESPGAEQREADTSSKIIQSQPLGQSPSQAQQVLLSSPGACHFCQRISASTCLMGSSLSVLGTQERTDQAQSEESQQNIKAEDKLEMPAADLTVRGTRMEAQQKLNSRKLSRTRPIKQKISSNTSKIRNYNIKD